MKTSSNLTFSINAPYKINFFRYSEIDSTNIEARRIIRTGGLQDWTIVLANTQTRGYGQGRRLWFSPLGGLYFSLIIPQVSKTKLQMLTIISAISLVKALREEFNLEAFIKWPNDILISAPKLNKKLEDHKLRKIAGILIENIISEKSRIAIIGIGLNTNIKKFPKDLSGKATSLAVQKKKHVDNMKTLKSFLNEFKQFFRERKDKILREYKKHEILAGRDVNITTENKKFLGKVLGFDKEGALMIKLRDGTIKKILNGTLERI